MRPPVLRSARSPTFGFAPAPAVPPSMALRPLRALRTACAAAGGGGSGAALLAVYQSLLERRTAGIAGVCAGHGEEGGGVGSGRWQGRAALSFNQRWCQKEDASPPPTPSRPAPWLPPLPAGDAELMGAPLRSQLLTALAALCELCMDEELGSALPAQVGGRGSGVGLGWGGVGWVGWVGWGGGGVGSGCSSCSASEGALPVPVTHPCPAARPRLPEPLPGALPAGGAAGRGGRARRCRGGQGGGRARAGAGGAV